jgi:hypothetical protein
MTADPIPILWSALVRVPIHCGHSDVRRLPIEGAGGQFEVGPQSETCCIPQPSAFMATMVAVADHRGPQPSR